MNGDAFKTADAEVAEFADAHIEETSIRVLGKETAVSSATDDVLEFRKRLVEKYHGGAPGLIEKLKKSGNNDVESLLEMMINEVIQETDHLLGNELVSATNGDLRDASVISFKRAEVLEKAIKAVQTKQQIEQQSGIDIDSPAMMIIFRYFLKKVKETFDKISLDAENNDLFFRTFGEMTNDWKKELRNNFNELRASQK